MAEDAVCRRGARFRQVFTQQPELVKELLRNKGFLDTLFDAKSGAFAALLAMPLEGTGDLDTLIGLIGDDGVSETPRQRTVAGRLQRRGWPIATKLGKHSGNTRN